MQTENQIKTLQNFLSEKLNKSVSIANFKRLTGGASLETYAFDAIYDDKNHEYILRSKNPLSKDIFENSNPLSTEAAIINILADNGVLVPKIIALSNENEELGEAYVVERLIGETLGQKIANSDNFAPARKLLGFQCGQELAKIHKINPPENIGLPIMTPNKTIDYYENIYCKYSKPRPILEFAINFLRKNAYDSDNYHLVHGDFRNGNLMVDENKGLVGILDWELSHIGSAEEDIGWLCCNSWRFGVNSRKIGGFAALEDFAKGYESEGGNMPDEKAINYWQLMGSFKWSIMIMMMRQSFKDGTTPTIERAVIARRLSETEADMIYLLEQANV